VSLKTRKNEENTTFIMPNKPYKFSHRIPSYKMSVTKGNALLRCFFLCLIMLLCQLKLVSWQGS